jgi:hypothetical protein
MQSLTSALGGGEWSVSRPGLFTSRERDPGTHWIGGWVSPRAVPDAVVKRKKSQPPPGIELWNPDRPAPSPVLYRLSYHVCNQKYPDWPPGTRTANDTVLCQ